MTTLGFPNRLTPNILKSSRCYHCQKHYKLSSFLLEIFSDMIACCTSAYTLLSPHMCTQSQRGHHLPRNWTVLNLVSLHSKIKCKWIVLSYPAKGVLWVYRYFSTERGRKSGSFVRESKLCTIACTGQTILSALQNKYGERETGKAHDSEEILLNGRVKLELVGAEKLQRQRGGIEKLEEVTLIDCNISSVVSRSLLCFWNSVSVWFLSHHITSHHITSHHITASTRCRERLVHIGMLLWLNDPLHIERRFFHVKS